MRPMSPLREASVRGQASVGAITFAPFKLIPAERRLEREGVEVQLGGRALEILIALVECAGEVLPKKDLMARVWPDVVVDEGSLRFHMVALRKALAEDAPNRFIVNVPGRGYCFVGTVSYPSSAPSAPPPRVASERRRTLPQRPPGVVGREQILRTISERLMARRFVSIVGPGGIGKTTAALCVGNALLSEFGDAVHFVDLAQVSDPGLLAGEIAAAVGLIQYSGSLTPGLVTFLRDKRLLLLLDNCEHVIGEAAAVAERIIQAAPDVYILATSREPLQVDGERVQRLFPLEYPPESEAPTAAEALEYPAVRHFVERATAAAEHFSFDDANVAVVVDICRRLDGIALAIELAAGGVEAYGLQGTAALLHSQFTLPLRGKRTASPRQQTLRATLDWSYTLLSDFERIAIRRLAVFVGPFTIEAAQSVVVTNDAEAEFFVEALANLVSKSLVIADPESHAARYRLLTTMRTYAWERLSDIGEVDVIARRHAIYFGQVLERAERDAALSTKTDWLALCGGMLGDVRAGLEWSFSSHGDSAVGIALAGVSAKYLLEMSLMSECSHWTERAINALDTGTRGTRGEMELQEAYGLVTMLSRGNRDEVRFAFEKGLQIATALQDVDHVMRNLGQLTLYYVRIGDYLNGRAVAERSAATAMASGDSSSMAMAEWMLGLSHNLAGDQAKAIGFCRAAVSRPLASRRINAIQQGIMDRCYALGALARALWLTGHSDQATRVVEDYVKEAGQAGHPLVYCMALIDTASVLVWTGKLEAAAESIDLLLARAAEHSLGPYRTIGQGWKGELEYRRGNADGGISLMRDCLDALNGDRHRVLAGAFSSYLAQAFASRGEFEPALDCIDAALTDAEIETGSYRIAESLRVKGDILAAMPQRDANGAEACYRKSLEIARAQSALAWELRTTMSRARLWAGQGRLAEAHAALESVYARFTEGFDTADLRAARVMLGELANWSAARKTTN